MKHKKSLLIAIGIKLGKFWRNLYLNFKKIQRPLDLSRLLVIRVEKESGYKELVVYEIKWE